jgi:hypothetical protein
MDEWEELLKHIEGFRHVASKQGKFHGYEEDQMMLVKAVRPVGNYGEEEGRWVVRYKGEFSYVSPELYNLLDAYTHKDVHGQTLRDGTIMCEEKSHLLAGRIPIGNGTSSVQSNYQEELVSGSTGAETHDSPTTLSQRHLASFNRRSNKRKMETVQISTTGEDRTNSKRRKVYNNTYRDIPNKSRIKKEDIAIVGRMNEELQDQKLTVFKLNHHEPPVELLSDFEDQPFDLAYRDELRDLHSSCVKVEFL